MVSNAMSSSGFPVVLSAASGTGKTTLASMLLGSDANLVLSVSTTTRAPRGEERDGIDYNFVDGTEFDDMVKRGAFIEWANVHANKYGSSKEWTSDTLDTGKDVLFDIDVQGGEQIRTLFPQACLIFVVPPSMDILERRLRNRATDDEETITRRMRAARTEIEAGLSSYDYVLTNESLERALFDLLSIVRAHRLRSLNREKIRDRLMSPNM